MSQDRATDAIPMTPEEIVREFRSVIEADARRIVGVTQDSAHVAIQAVCECFEVGEYDWKNSSEGFDDWAKRNFSSQPSVLAVLLKHYNMIEQAAAYFSRVYYGLRQ